LTASCLRCLLRDPYKIALIWKLRWIVTKD
jgi:hypothetical protein